MFPPLESSTTMGKLLTLIVAQAIPAKANKTEMSHDGDALVMKMAPKNANAYNATPMRMDFLRPILLASNPTGM